MGQSRVSLSDHTEEIQRELVQRGYIYKGVHSGWYAVSDEAFYTSKQVEEVVDPQTGEKHHVCTSSLHTNRLMFL